MLIFTRAICASLMAALLFGIADYCWRRCVPMERNQSLKWQRFVLFFTIFICSGLLGQNIGSLLWAYFHR